MPLLSIRVSVRIKSLTAWAGWINLWMIFWVWVLERASSYANKQLGWVACCSSAASILPFLSHSGMSLCHQNLFQPPLPLSSSSFISPSLLFPFIIPPWSPPHLSLSLSHTLSLSHSLSHTHPLWCWPCVNGPEWWVRIKLCVCVCVCVYVCVCVCVCLRRTCTKGDESLSAWHTARF